MTYLYDIVKLEGASLDQQLVAKTVCLECFSLELVPESLDHRCWVSSVQLWHNNLKKLYLIPELVLDTLYMLTWTSSHWYEKYFRVFFFTHFSNTTAPQQVISNGKLSTIIIFKPCIKLNKICWRCVLCPTKKITQILKGPRRHLFCFFFFLHQNLTGIITLLSICILVLATPSLASKHRERSSTRTKTKRDCPKNKSDRPAKRHTNDDAMRFITPGQPAAAPPTCSDCKCTWTFYIDEDDNRIPREMFFANCSDVDTGCGPDDTCRKTYYTMMVLRRSDPSANVWEMAEESVPTACVCRQPGGSTTDAN